jgi:glycolate oxidase
LSTPPPHIVAPAVKVASGPPLDVYESLARELGAERVLRNDSELGRFAEDRSGLGRYPADAAALCSSAEQVQLVLQWAAAHRVPVTPRGAGSGMTGGALPTRGGLVLSTERMQRVKEIDEESLVAVVEPGVITGELQAQVEALGLFYPPDPASLAYCSLGGNVAENAGGPRALKYGTTREYVLGLEVALMGGQRLRTGRRTAKGVTGYDITALFVGSEGTLGVATELTLRLLPKPEAAATMLATFGDLIDAGIAVTRVLRQGFRPRVVELMDHAAIEHIRPRATYRIPPGARALMIIELDGEQVAMAHSVQRCADLCLDAGATDVQVANNEDERDRLWQTRRITSTCLKEVHPIKVSEDIVVPRRHIPEILRRIDHVAGKYNLLVATFGHAGDGNLHVNLLSDEPHKEGAIARRIEDARGDVFRETLALGGTLSGEHGIGLTKKPFLSWEQPAELIALQRKLKRAFDPEDLLNPGKIFPDV